MDSREEVAGGFVITCGNRPKVLELKEEVLDQVPVFVAFGVISTGGKPVGFGGNNGLGAFGLKEVEHPCSGVIGFISQQVVSFDLRQ